MIKSIVPPSWRLLLRAGLIVSALTLALEVLARQRYGLGNPPLFLSDPQIEYRIAPNQELRRFGNRISINSAGMRSEPLAMPRPTGLRRLLVIGDSVVWGGAQLDQASIATERLRQPGLEVANLGVPSWGPANQLAYVQRYGLFDATDVVLVISSHDAADVPSSSPFRGDNDRPIHPPIGALAELLQRYGMPRLRQALPILPPPKPAHNEWSSAAGVDPRSLASLDELLSLLKRSGAQVAAVQHWERQEIDQQPLPGHHAIAKVLKRHQIPVVQGGPLFRGCGPLDDLYTDAIHPYTAAGQACLAEAIRQAMARGVVSHR